MSTPATPATMPQRNPLFNFLEGFRAQLAAGERPDELSGPFGQHAVVYHEEGEGPYASVGFMLPDGFYAVGDGDTYLQLEAFRVYLEDCTATQAPDAPVQPAVVAPGRRLVL